MLWALYTILQFSVEWLVAHPSDAWGFDRNHRLITVHSWASRELCFIPSTNNSNNMKNTSNRRIESYINTRNTYKYIIIKCCLSRKTYERKAFVDRVEDSRYLLYGTHETLVFSPFIYHRKMCICCTEWLLIVILIECIWLTLICKDVIFTAGDFVFFFCTSYDLLCVYASTLYVYYILS